MVKLKSIHIWRFKGIDDLIIEDCTVVNALYGRNNSGKSTILHALDMAGLALSTRNWTQFQPKLEIKDMFHEAGPFEIELTYTDGSHVIIRQSSGFGPVFDQEPTDEQRFRSIYIIPDPGIGLIRRRHKTPKSVLENMEARNFSDINGLDILFALKFYADRAERGLQKEDYERIINDIKRFFPEIEKITSDRTEDDIATLIYKEYGQNLDVIYAGAGLKHFVDIFVKTTLSQASVVLIDEPEMGLHPSLQQEILTHFLKLNSEKGTQFFIATHSPIFLSNSEDVTSYVIQNRKGQRSAIRVPIESIHTVWGDLGIHPSNLLQNDIVVLVEGQGDVIFFDYVINELYRNELSEVAIAIVQYAGDAAGGIIDGTISVENIVTGSSHRLWIRDRDSSPKEKPATNSTKFKNALEKYGENCRILEKREIEFYFPEAVHVEAQQGDADKENLIREILSGEQSTKFTVSASAGCCAVARGKNLRKLLQKYLTQNNLSNEIRQLVEQTLIPWRKDILGID